MRSNGAKEKNFIMNEVAVFFGSGGGEDRPHRMANQNWVIEVFVEDVIRDKVRVAIFIKIGKISLNYVNIQEVMICKMKSLIYLLDWIIKTISNLRIVILKHII